MISNKVIDKKGGAVVNETPMKVISIHGPKQQYIAEDDHLTVGEEDGNSVVESIQNTNASEK